MAKEPKKYTGKQIAEYFDKSRPARSSDQPAQFHVPAKLGVATDEFNESLDRAT